MTGASTRRALPWFTILALYVAAMTLRGPILSVTPVMRDIERDLGLDATAASLLTTVPVLLFAALAPVAALVIRRAGPGLALLGCLSFVVVGTLIRGVPSFGWMLVGTTVIGAGITVGNVVVPVIIRREVPPERIATVTAGYTATLNVGSLLVTLGTAPIAGVVGWPLAVLSWGVIALLGWVLWLLQLRRDPAGRTAGGERYSGDAADASTGAQAAGGSHPQTGQLPLETGPLVVPRGGGRGIAHRPVIWLLLGAFACQSAAYYALSTWLPTLLGDEIGASPAAAGALASILQGVAILGAFVVPLLTRFAPLAVPTALVSACWLTLSIGLLVAPELFVLWAVFGAIGQAGGFVTIFTVLTQVSRSDAEAASGSAIVQGGAYVFGALGAPVLGALHDATGEWTGPLVVVVGLTVCFSALLMSAAVAARGALSGR